MESNDVGFIDAVGNSIALTLWSFLGLESAAVNMDAVENPQRSVPIATFVSTLGVAFIYVASTNVIAGIVPNAEILSSSAPSAWPFRTCSALRPARSSWADGLLLRRLAPVVAVYPGPRL